MISSNRQLFKVLFATGQFNFDSAYAYTKETLTKFSNNIEVTRCEKSLLTSNMQNTTVLIPFMTPITKSIIQNSPSLKLIIQFGVGLEGNHCTSLSSFVESFLEC